MNERRPLEDQVAIVTGAAHGIGAATARRLARDGARVVVSDIDHVGAERVAHDIGGFGGTAIALAADMGDPSAPDRLVDETVAHFGTINLVDHNAAWTDFARDSDAETIALATWEHVISTNATSGLLLAQAAMPYLIEGGGGAIVMISSGSAHIGEHRRVAYGVSKAAIEQLVRHLAARYGAHGVRTNAIAPGFIATKSAMAAIGESDRARLAAANPLGRLGEPDDIASVVAFLCSADAAFINGQVICVDGGLTIAPRLSANTNTDV